HQLSARVRRVHDKDHFEPNAPVMERECANTGIFEPIAGIELERGQLFARIAGRPHRRPPSVTRLTLPAWLSVFCSLASFIAPPVIGGVPLSGSTMFGGFSNRMSAA